MNSYIEIRNKIIEVFEVNGFYLPITAEGEEDINISEYEISSLEFISIIIQLEEVFEINIPDEKLTMELFHSFFGLTDFIYDLLRET